MTTRDTALLEFLIQFITDERRQRFEEVLDYRTRHITVVLEDIFQPHNASAVLRSCDLRGIQDIHIVENNYEYDVNPDVVLGSTKWLNLYHYKLSEICPSWRYPIVGTRAILRPASWRALHHLCSFPGSLNVFMASELY